MRELSLNPNPSGDPPDGSMCDCGDAVEPVWNPMGPGGWLVPASCDPCIYAGHTVERWRRRTDPHRLFRTPVPNRTLEGYRLDRDGEPAGDGEALGAATAWTGEGEKPGLFFHGHPGGGKTHLAAAVARKFAGYRRSVRTALGHDIPPPLRDAVAERVEQAFPDGPPGAKTVIFATAPRLLDRIRSTYDRQNEDTELLMGELAGADLLVIDDLGAEKPSEWASEKLFRIIDERGQAGRPFIVTTNHSLAGLAGRYATSDFPGGDRMASRIAGHCQIVQVNAPDYRIRSHA